MSRKTLRNLTRKARQGSAPAGASGAARTRIALSGLALGSLTFAVSGVLHAQNASSAAGRDHAQAPRPSAKSKLQARKRLGHPATLHLAANSALPANGTGLLAQATTPAAGQTVPAPTTGAAQLQEIVVTGIRGSLQRSLQIKRLSLGVVDAISAEDIGQFPDSSIGGALERIPGVSVSRGSAAEGNSTIGNVTGVTVRGFGDQFSETLIDGRQIAGGGTGGTSIDFSSLGAEFVGEIAVHKTPDFSLSSGDIGATINIKYPRPFDHPGLQARAFASETDSPLDGGARPAFGALISDTFADGKLGILVDGDYTDHHVTAHHVSVAGWVGTYFEQCQMAGGPACSPTGSNPRNTFPSWYEQEYQVFQERTDERRKDGRVVLQWHPTDNVLVTLNDDYSDDRINTYSGGFSNWFSGGAFSNITQAPDGTVTDFTTGPNPTDLDGALNSSYVKTNTPGLNVIWDVSDDWSAELDADQSVSQINPYGNVGEGQDVGFGPSGPGGINGYTAGIVDTGSSDALLYPSAFGPNNDGNVYQPDIYGSHVDIISVVEQSDTINEGKLDATWHHDSTKVNFGVQLISDTRRSMQWTTFINGNNQWELFAGYGPASHNTGGVALPASLFTSSFSTANFIPGYANNGKLPPVMPWYDPFAVTAYEESLGVGAANPNYGPQNGYTYDGTVTPQFAPGSPVVIRMKDYSPYFTSEHNFDVGGMTLKASLGMRYDRTDVTSGGVAQLPTALTVEPADHTAFIPSQTPPEFVQVSHSYAYLLPSLDLNLMVLPDLKVRFDVSRTETKPPLGNITPTLSLTGTRVGALAAAGNNPDLLPYLSDNFDLGAEWYYASNDYVAADFFYKKVSQFPVSQTIETTINGVMDPTTGQLAQWKKTTYVNGPSTDVRGVELGWQQMLKWGFGFQINGTLVATNSPYNPNALTNVFALPGISNEANLIAFYQRGGFQARVSVNWTGQQLLFFGQDNAGATFGTEPTFLNANTHVDFSSSYDINSHLSVYFEGLNLTNSIYSTHGRFSNQALDVVEYGPSLTLGVRAKL